MVEPNLKQFVMLSMSETFSQARRYLAGVEYDREKLVAGLLDLCALFEIETVTPDPPEIIRVPEPRLLHKACLYCKRPLNHPGRRSFGYHTRCERKLRSEHRFPPIINEQRRVK